ncbi:GNAT family N-acetyltransferase [Streptomyces sp. NPDC006678]|uniref:GNAT family N-acetyltransferase n=1 Tax=Streptomyces sp. NPDC006678 TaxID=3157185 RepID=UPI0033F805EA
MDHDAVLALYDRQMRRDAPADGPGARVERVGGVVRQTAGDHGWNGVLWSGLDATTADAAIAEQVRHFAAGGCEFEWKLYGHDRPSDLADRLLAAGFVPEPAETLLVAPTDEVAAESADGRADSRRDGPELPPGVEFHQVTDAAGVDLLARVHEEAFGTDSSRLRAQLLAQLTAGPAGLVAVVAMAGDVPVSSSRLELPPGGSDFAGLWGGGTVPRWRGRGLYRASVAHRARIAAERGYRYLQVDAMPSSRPILERLGFTALSTTTPYVHRPGAPGPH